MVYMIKSGLALFLIPPPPKKKKKSKFVVAQFENSLFLAFQFTESERSALFFMRIRCTYIETVDKRQIDILKLPLCMQYEKKKNKAVRKIKGR